MAIEGRRFQSLCFPDTRMIFARGRASVFALLAASSASLNWFIPAFVKSRSDRRPGRAGLETIRWRVLEELRNDARISLESLR